MADIVDSSTRSRMMSGIRGKNTKPEMMIRQGLHRKGFRYRLHDRKLPGKPDLVFPSRQAVIFVNGCFWHGHDCHLFRMPSTRRDFWKIKIDGNRQRDFDNMLKINDYGWRILVIWECALKGKSQLPFDEIMEKVSGWLDSDCGNLELKG